MTNIRWHGRGGQGAFTASKILGAAAVYEDGYALSFPSFGPERRGAPIQAFTKIDENSVTDRSVLKKADYIIYLDETLFNDSALNDLEPNGLLFINSNDKDKYAYDKRIVVVDANKISKQIIGREVSNTSMLAALVAKTGIVKAESVKNVLANYLPKKIAKKNEGIFDVDWR